MQCYGQKVLKEAYKLYEPFILRKKKWILQSRVTYAHMAVYKKCSIFIIDIEALTVEET